MTTWILATTLAWATSGFEPASPEAVFTDTETYTQDGEIKLWSAIERYGDPDRTLFEQEAFNDLLAWPNADHAPWIARAFGTSTPHSSQFLLHLGLNEPASSGTPILLVPGAGDNATRAYVTMGTRLDRTFRPVYALTFAHPHGDVLQQAEVIADAIAVITQRTGAAQVDVVAHSKGGMAAVTYAANTADAELGSAYDQVGTDYRGDIRKLVLIATPLGGIDTAYRWPGGNLLQLDASRAIAPTSWDTHYPYGTGSLITTDLRDQDFLPDGADYFPGQRQLLRRQNHRLGGYALQPDWYTTYEGGLGAQSYSDGFDAAITAGGDYLDTLSAEGVDPDIALYVLAGTNPIMPNGDEQFADLWDGVATAAEWGTLIASINDNGVPLTASTDELDGLASGDLVLGEITGRSDGLVFLDSATRSTALTARGAVVHEVKQANLSHVDLLYASPVTGQLLIDAYNEDPANNAWMRAVGQRYKDEDTLGWVEEVLADPETEDTGLGDSGLTTDDTGGVLDTGEAGPAARPCGGCSGAPAVAGWWLLPLIFGIRRRR